MSDQEQHDSLDSSKAPLMEHVIELRQRLIWAVAAIILCFVVSFYFSEYIFDFLVQPLKKAFPDGETTLIFTKLYEAFFVEIKVAMFSSFFMAFPILAAQLYAFVAPGLYSNEKRAFLPFLLATPLLFLAGSALAYYIVMPTAFEFFLDFQSNDDGIKQQALPAMGDYLSLVMQFILAFGICFQLPILLLLLNRAEIVSREQLRGFRRFMIVGSFLLAAILTPPDVISQLMLGIPLILLYEISLIIIYFTEKKQKSTDI